MDICDIWFGFRFKSKRYIYIGVVRKNIFFEFQNKHEYYCEKLKATNDDPDRINFIS